MAEKYPKCGYCPTCGRSNASANVYPPSVITMPAPQTSTVWYGFDPEPQTINGPTLPYYPSVPEYAQDGAC